ncbi:MAG: DNA alkylation repair protein [Bacteroidetes bacterium]|nr:DNA alkylation repair protein [Bacteroidota bacterium]
MTVKEIMAELEAKGNVGVKNIFLKHGVKEPLFGVKIEYLKVIQKKVKKDYQLAKDLYATGNADAMYLAGLIADEDKMTKKDLSLWVKQAESTNISEYTVPWIAAESHFGYELALEWIDSKTEHVATAGWATLSSVMSIKPDSELDIPALKKLITRVEKEIHTVSNRVRSNMNGFVIAAGCFVPALTDAAMNASKKIGAVKVNTDGTACKVPDAAIYINKVKDKGTLGKKKKMARC